MQNMPMPPKKWFTALNLGGGVTNFYFIDQKPVYFSICLPQNMDHQLTCWLGSFHCLLYTVQLGKVTLHYMQNQGQSQHDPYDFINWKNMFFCLYKGPLECLICLYVDSLLAEKGQLFALNMCVFCHIFGCGAPETSPKCLELIT